MDIVIYNFFPGLDECLTVSGASPNTPCMNSFKYLDITYNTCSLKNAPEGKPWCSTKVDEAGVHIGGKGNWGNCGTNCPMPGDQIDVSSGMFELSDVSSKKIETQKSIFSDKFS